MSRGSGSWHLVKRGKLFKRRTLAQHVDGSIASDHAEPCSQVSALGDEALRTLPNLKKDFLHHVLRQARLAQHAQGNAVDNPRIAVIDRRHGILASFGHCFKQGGVIHGVNLFALFKLSMLIASTMDWGQRIGRLKIGLRW
jgi:hypothetical protein